MVKSCRKRDDLMKLSKKDRYSIQFLHEQGKDANYIAKDLKIDIDQVSRVLKTISKIVEVIPKEKPKTSKVNSLMIKQTAVKKDSSVSIMTQGASQVGDEFYKKISDNKSEKDQHIYRRPE